LWAAWHILRSKVDATSRAGWKAWKKKKGKLKVTLGRNIGMEAAGCFFVRGLVGRFGYGALGARDIHEWVEDSWLPVLGYSSKVYVIIKGFFFFLFKSAMDAELILQRNWVVKSGSLMLKRWNIAFNSVKEHFKFIHLWMLLPGCPLVLWKLEAFREINNALGKFLHADPNVLEGSDMRMGRILMEMDPIDGLPTDLDINWCGFTFQQRLDYLGVPFRCVVCKGTRHLRH
jgi:hypothetical protein